ncbi:MAG TPA: ATP-binding protein [Anaerolineae bacterium]|nr:ATP-binding protein [Anaerolineae bacterium]
MPEPTADSGELLQADHPASLQNQDAEVDQKLSTIFQIARILAQHQNQEDMLSQLLSCLVENLDAADAALLLLYDPADGQLAVRGAWGYDFSILEEVRLAPGEAMCGRAFETGRPGLYPTINTVTEAGANLRPSNRDLFQTAATGQRPIKSAICMPLFNGEAKVGALLLGNRHRQHGFVEPDMPFLQALADLIALTIENTHLRRELQATQALEEANRLKAELISILAHEMRTPLTSIKGYSTALLMEEASFGSETQREFLQIVDEECDVLQDLIHDLLESSVIDAGLLRLEPQPVRLPQLARGVTDDMAHRTQIHRFLTDFAEPFPIVDADPKRIEQVLRNLLDNAVKYSPQGGLIVVRGEIRGDEVVVSVADQGVGIAPEHVNRLFEKFFRVTSALGRHVVGSGLGLPIARTIVESHGGRIWAESQLGQGSTLSFTLPLDGVAGELSRRKGASE